MKKSYPIQEILKGCLKKQSVYQRALVDQFSGMLLVICKRYLNNDELAKDLVQDSWVKIFKNLDKYDDKIGGFESWISTICIRLCLSKLSKNKLRLVSIQEQVEDAEMESYEADSLDTLETEYLLKMVMELPDGYREVFNMSAIDGYTYADISKELNVSQDVCRARLSRAKKMLRKKIDRLKKQELWVNSI